MAIDDMKIPNWAIWILGVMFACLSLTITVFVPITYEIFRDMNHNIGKMQEDISELKSDVSTLKLSTQMSEQLPSRISECERRLGAVYSQLNITW